MLFSIHIVTSELSESLHKQSATSISNIYRKQYGNLQQLFNTQYVLSNVIHYEKDVLKLQSLTTIQNAVDAGTIDPAILTKAKSIHELHQTWQLQTLRINNQNICRICKQDYPMAIADLEVCDGQKHQPMYDFTKNEDVNLCTI